MKLYLSHGARGSTTAGEAPPVRDWFIVEGGDLQVERLRNAGRRVVALTDEVMDAQADLQVALGVHRLDPVKHADMVEDRMVRVLARLHTLLDTIGTPMYDATVHPDVPRGPTDHKAAV